MKTTNFSSQEFNVGLFVRPKQGYATSNKVDINNLMFAEITRLYKNYNNTGKTCITITPIVGSCLCYGDVIDSINKRSVMVFVNEFELVEKVSLDVDYEFF